MTRRINAGRGQPRPAAEGRRAGEIADGGVGQLRADHREAESRRRDGREAADRQGAVRPVQLAGRAGRPAGGRLEKGEGTAGQLLHDKQLYDNMNAAANELRALIGDIRKDPKKYLNVRVSIF